MMVETDPKAVRLSKIIVVREWDPDQFHAKVLELEKQGYVANRDTYRITAEMNPETGIITHLHSIELTKGEGK